MTDDSPLDPAKLMRAFFTAWDQGRSPAPAPRAADDKPRDDKPADLAAFAPAMRMMAQAFAVANMPSRDDMDGIARRLDRIEALLIRLDDRVSGLEGRAAAPAEVHDGKGDDGQAVNAEGHEAATAKKPPKKKR